MFFSVSFLAVGPFFFFCLSCSLICLLVSVSRSTPLISCAFSSSWSSSDSLFQRAVAMDALSQVEIAPLSPEEAEEQQEEDGREAVSEEEERSRPQSEQEQEGEQDGEQDGGAEEGEEEQEEEEEEEEKPAPRPAKKARVADEDLEETALALLRRSKQ